MLVLREWSKAQNLDAVTTELALGNGQLRVIN
jgi:hypothetical protein